MIFLNKKSFLITEQLEGMSHNNHKRKPTDLKTMLENSF